MSTLVTLASAEQLLPLRTRYRDEAQGQIVHDSLHRRSGWARSFLLSVDDAAVGFGSVAVAGPWADRPTIFEFYLLPDCWTRAFTLFEAFLSTSEARFVEVQTTDTLLTVMLHAYARVTGSEKLLFADGGTTTLPSNGAELSALTERAELLASIERRQGGGDWVLHVEGRVAAKGGLLFHYNRPYGDVWMEVDEGFRRRGFGSFLVQELKRECYALGAIPAARCDLANAASRATLQRAGFVPRGHIVHGELLTRV